jgi:pimeloyl-ACP methyl ester carboxylesterase
MIKREAMGMQLPTMTKARGDGIHLQLAIWPGRRGPVLLVHGLTANCRCWDGLAARLAGDYRLLAVDLRGRGLSDKPESGYSEAHHVRDLACLMQDLALPRVVLCGHSLGAYIALAFAAQNPCQARGLILIDGGGDLDADHWARVDEAIKPAVDRLDQIYPSINDFLNLMRKAPFLKPWNSTIDAYFRYDLIKVPTGVRSRINAAHIREEVTHKHATSPSPCYSKIACPVLILRATQGILTPEDILLPPAVVGKMLAEMPHARCVDISGSNHYSILLQPNKTRDRAIADFLREILVSDFSC